MHPPTIVEEASASHVCPLGECSSTPVGIVGCDNGAVAPPPGSPLLALARELERRDNAVARELEEVIAVAERAAHVRSRAAATRAALQTVPAEREELARRRHDADVELTDARMSLAAAAARLEGLSSSRRRRADEVERAEKEVATAREALSDAESRLGRANALEAALELRARQLDSETARLGEDAAAVASELGALERGAPATADPGAELVALEAWGGQVRSALFVARATLEQERERIVVEANALGASVLGEELGTLSVALVRRRLEQLG